MEDQAPFLHHYYYHLKTQKKQSLKHQNRASRIIHNRRIKASLVALTAQCDHKLMLTYYQYKLYAALDLRAFNPLSVLQKCKVVID
jgi:hypothetical protein